MEGGGRHAEKKGGVAATRLTERNPLTKKGTQSTTQRQQEDL